jgi:hypothetical protein
MDELVLLYYLIIIGSIIALCLGMVAAIVDVCGHEVLDDAVIACTITHMDVDDNNAFIAVVGGDFSKIIEVTDEQYANYNVGDRCTVVQKGDYWPLRGTIYSYEIVD